MEGDLVWAVQTSYDPGSMATFSNQGRVLGGTEGGYWAGKAKMIRVLVLMILLSFQTFSTRPFAG